MEEIEAIELFPEAMQFQVRVETDVEVIYKQLQNALKNYKNDNRGATVVLVQSPMGNNFKTTL